MNTVKIPGMSKFTHIAITPAQDNNHLPLRLHNQAGFIVHYYAMISSHDIWCYCVSRALGGTCPGSWAPSKLKRYRIILILK